MLYSSSTLRYCLELGSARIKAQLTLSHFTHLPHLTNKLRRSFNCCNLPLCGFSSDLKFCYKSTIAQTSSHFSPSLQLKRASRTMSANGTNGANGAEGVASLNASNIHPDPKFMYFPSRRSTVHSTKGIVSSTQPLASQCGVRILREGGNAAVRS